MSLLVIPRGGWRLSSPHPDHHPSVGRFERGRAAVSGRPLYGTDLRCYCTGNTCRPVRVSNQPPSRSKADACRHYRLHLLAAGVPVAEVFEGRFLVNLHGTAPQAEHLRECAAEAEA